jgi:hypothetical protein
VVSADLEGTTIMNTASSAADGTGPAVTVTPP